MAETTFGARETLLSPEAETALIASVMFDGEAAFEAAERLRPEHFGDPVHGRLWRAAVGLTMQGRYASPHHVRDALGLDDGFESWGGIDRLVDLERTAKLADLQQNIGTVLDRAVRRGTRKLAIEVEALAEDTSRLSAVEVLGELERGAGRLAQETVSRDFWLSGADVIESALESAKARFGEVLFPTGLTDLDALTGGFNPGELAILAGRAGMAKSTGGLQIAKANASLGKGTLFLSLEMDREPLGLRMACDLAYQRGGAVYSAMPSANLNATYDRARKNLLAPEQWGRLRETVHLVREWPVRFDVRPGLTLTQIEAVARRAYREWDRLGIPRGPLIIDHLGIIKPEQNRSGNKVAETADISRGLAEMAKRLGVPVIALCQVGRATESREDKRPGLADLRWSGSIEEDARQVIFLYRPEYYLSRPPAEPESFEQETERLEKLQKVKNKLFWIVAKNNNGEVGQVETFCDVACSAIRDAARPE